jgi:hypothetical protein
VRARLDHARRIDDERRLAHGDPGFDETRNAFVRAQLATPRIS